MAKMKSSVHCDLTQIKKQKVPKSGDVLLNEIEQDGWIDILAILF